MTDVLLKAVPLFKVLCSVFFWGTRMDHVDSIDYKIRSLRIIVSDRANKDKRCVIHVREDGFYYWDSSQDSSEDDEYIESDSVVLERVYRFLR